MMKFFAAVMMAALWSIAAVSEAAIGDPPFISFSKAPGAPLVENGRATNLWLDANEFPAVLRAAGDLQTDISKVSGVKPQVHTAGTVQGKVVLVAGTVGRSGLIGTLVQQRKLDLRAITGKWEAFVIEVIPRP